MTRRVVRPGRDRRPALLRRIDIGWSKLHERSRLPDPGWDSRPGWRRVFDWWRLPPAILSAEDLIVVRLRCEFVCEACWWRWVVMRRLRHHRCSAAITRAIKRLGSSPCG